MDNDDGNHDGNDDNNDDGKDNDYDNDDGNDDNNDDGNDDDNDGKDNDDGNCRQTLRRRAKPTQTRWWRTFARPSKNWCLTIIMMMMIIIIIIMMIIIMILMMTTMMMLMTNTMMRTFALCLQRTGPIMINPKKIMTFMIIMMLDHHDGGEGFRRCWFY